MPETRFNARYLGLMQTEKSQREGKWIMPETRYTEFLALPVDPRAWISLSASETNVCLFFLTYDIKNYKLSFVMSFIFYILRRITTFGVRRGGG